MRLTQRFREEYLAPEYNFNPLAQRLSKAITTRALNSESTIPDIDKRFDYQFHLNDIIKAKLGGIDTELAERFKIKKGKITHITSFIVEQSCLSV